MPRNRQTLVYDTFDIQLHFKRANLSKKTKLVSRSTTRETATKIMGTVHQKLETADIIVEQPLSEPFMTSTTKLRCHTLNIAKTHFKRPEGRGEYQN